MERSGYDRRKRPSDLPPTDHHRRSREYVAEDTRARNHFISNNPQPYYNPRDHHQAKTADNHRTYQTPSQEYRSPPTPDTPYAGAPRYTSYETPRSSQNDSHADSSAYRRGNRYPREPTPAFPPSLPDNRMSSKVIWQYNIPQDESTNQICEKYERPMDPKEFKEQCRKAYLQAAEERKRNAEMSVWGKCNWAIYDGCEGPNRR